MAQCLKHGQYSGPYDWVIIPLHKMEDVVIVNSFGRHCVIPTDITVESCMIVTVFDCKLKIDVGKNHQNNQRNNHENLGK